MAADGELEFRRAAAFGNRILHGLVGSTIHGLEFIGQGRSLAGRGAGRGPAIGGAGKSFSGVVRVVGWR